MAEQYFEHSLGLLNTRDSRFIYWTVLKLLLWVIPSLVVLRRSGATFSGTMAFGRVREILLRGGGLGIALGLTAVIPKLLNHQPLIPTHPDSSFFSAVFIAPLVEEIAFRGVVQSALVKRWPFALANVVQALLFLTIHMVGWSFQGVLMPNLTAPIGGALSIFGIGLLLGYVAHKSRSVAASTLTHMLNNLASS